VSLVVCRPPNPTSSEELRRRFVKAECAFFRIRYESDDRKEREKFNWIPVRPFTPLPIRSFMVSTQVEQDERDRYHQELLAASLLMKSDKSQEEKYYKVLAGAV